MPLSALVCYCPSCRGEQVVDPQEALDHAAARRGGPFTYELLAAMLGTVQDRGDRISTTTLTGKCLRSEHLKRKQPYTEDPQKLYASFRGTMFHGQLEKYAHPDAIAEARFHVDLPEGHLSGSPDLLDVKTGTLYDYKFCKEVPRWEYAWKDHIAQMNVNRWLVDHAETVEWNGGTFDMSDPKNQARFRPVDWQGLIVVYMDDKGSKPILITRSEDAPTKAGGTKKVRVADLWDDERTERYIRDNYAAAQAALEGNTLPDIPEGYEYWQHPLCGYCPVKDQCVELFVNERKVA